LGALLYQLISGRAPLETRGLSLAELVRRVCSEKPPAPSRAPAHADRVATGAQSADLDAIVLQALAKAPLDRYATVDALLADLDNAAALRPVSARGTPYGYRMRRFLRRNRLAVAVCALLALALTLGLAGTLWQARVAARERDGALFLAERSDAARDFLVRLLSENSGDAPLGPKALTERASALLEQEPAMRSDVRAMMRDVVAELHLERRDFASAERAFQSMVDESPKGEPNELVVDAMCQLGAVKNVLGKNDEARRWLDDGLAHARGLQGSARVTLARCLSYAGTLALDLADRPRAIALSREAVDVIDHLGGRYASRQSALHNNYANILASAGQMRASQAEYGRALDLLADAGRSRSADASTAAGNLARATDEAGLPREADVEFERAIALRREVSGESVGLAQQLTTHAGVLVELGRAQDALTALDDAAVILQSIGDTSDARQALLHLRRAGAYIEDGEREEAESEFDRSESFYLKKSSPQSKALNAISLGRAALWMRATRTPADLERAAVEIDQASARERAAGDSSLSLKVLLASAELALLRNDFGAAVSRAREARDRNAENLDPRAWQLAACDAILGAASIRLGHANDGNALLNAAIPRLGAELGDDHWRTRQARDWLAQSAEKVAGH
jgi:hypothetical protein